MPKPVGRWRTENCNSQLNRKIDLSNEDHCGPCGQRAMLSHSGHQRWPPNTTNFEDDQMSSEKFSQYVLEKIELKNNKNNKKV